MAQRGHHVEVVEIADAEHDLHLDRPAEWRTAVTRSVDALAS
jgi:pimeloyl-ACP methyl ester carboxylesterase